MLKILSPINLQPLPEVKCAEIFCNNLTELTIYCNFCKIKEFNLEDFVQHLQNIHFESYREKAGIITEECFQADATELKNFKDEMGLKSLGEKIDLELDFECSEEDEPECLKILKTEEKPRTLEIVYDSTGKQKDDLDLEFDSIELENFKNEMCLKTLEGKNLLVRDFESSEEDEQACLVRDEKQRTPENAYQSNGEDYINKLNTSNVIDNNSSKNSNKTKNLQYKPLEFPCAECPQIFSRKHLLDNHAFEEHGGYKCSLCDRRLRLSHHLRRHELTHNTDRKYPCLVEKCGRVFAHSDYLKRHLEVHNKERTFICEFKHCGKAFPSKLHLRSHRYVHKKLKKHVCEICGYACAALLTLEIHQRQHTGEKPFGCDVCGKSFSSRTGLNVHMISHDSKREFVCNICQATFAKKAILQSHQLRHSDERTFKCVYCEKTFKQRSGLDNHIMYVHKKVKEWPKKRKKAEINTKIN